MIKIKKKTCLGVEESQFSCLSCVLPKLLEEGALLLVGLFEVEPLVKNGAEREKLGADDLVPLPQRLLDRPVSYRNLDLHREPRPLLQKPLPQGLDTVEARADVPRARDDDANQLEELLRRKPSQLKQLLLCI